MSTPYNTQKGKETPMKCSKCTSAMNLVRGPFGHYYACSSYRCNNTVGCYSVPEEVSFIALSIMNAFSPYITKHLVPLNQITVNLESLGKGDSFDEKTQGGLLFNDHGFTIRINPHYNFRTKFEILEFIVRRFVSGWKMMESVLFDFSAMARLGDEVSFIAALPEKTRKQNYGQMALKTSEIMDGVFDHTFGMIQTSAVKEEKKPIDYPF